MAITLKTGAAFSLDLTDSTFNLDQITPGNIDTFSSTRITGSDDDGIKFVIKGSGFTHNQQGALTGGEIHTITDSVGGALASSITGLHLSVKSALAVFHTPTKTDDVQLLQSVLSGDDDLTGGKQADKIYGYKGDDKLYGNAGNDRLDGGQGNDALYGNGDVDQLTGGAGKDTFFFLAVKDSSSLTGRQDTITDFVHGSDHINLKAIDAVLGGSDNAFKFIGTDAFSGAGGELRYEIKGSDTYIYADNDADGKAEIAIHLDHAIDLVKGDFIL